MAHRLSSFFTGRVRLRIEAPPQTVGDLLIRSGIPLADRFSADGYRECTLAHRDAKALLALCAAKGLPCTVQEEKGILPTLRKLLRRPGQIIGVLFLVFLLFESENYVWEIDVTGNERLSESEVLTLLAKEGFCVGARHRSLDLHRLCNRLPLLSGDLAWVSVNMMGSTAEVQVVEQRSKPQPEEPDGAPVNLVAARAGQIVRYELSSGRVVAGVGTVVAPGQLLVAGYSEKETGLHARASKGRVMARTVLTESAFCAFEESVTVRTEPILLQKSLIFSGKEIFFHKTGLQSDERYDTIDDEYRPTVFGVALPVSVKRVYALPTKETRIYHSEKEAEKAAENEALSRLRRASGEIEEVRLEVFKGTDGVTVRCTADCIVDIAKEVKVIPPEEYKTPAG